MRRLPRDGGTRARSAIAAAFLVGGCALAHERGVDANVDAPLSPEMSCAATGGHWRHGPCCPTVCGAECPLACVSSNCACAADQIWDDALGCTHSATCDR